MLVNFINFSYFLFLFKYMDFLMIYFWIIWFIKIYFIYIGLLFFKFFNLLEFYNNFLIYKFRFISIYLPKIVKYNVLKLNNILLISGFFGSRLLKLSCFCYFFDYFYFLLNFSEFLLKFYKYFLKFNFFFYKFLYFKNIKIFKYVFMSIKLLSFSISCGFFFELRLYGSGYFIVKGFKGCSKYLYCIFLGKNHFIYINFWNKNNSLVRVGKNFIFFFSINKFKLYNIIFYGLLLRNVSFYKLNGILFPEQLIIIRLRRKKIT